MKLLVSRRKGHVVNACLVKKFHLGVVDGRYFGLYADDILLEGFETTDDAIEELKKITSLLASADESTPLIYYVGE